MKKFTLLACCTPMFASLIANAQIINTVAGNGWGGYAGDGGQATAAELSNPNGVAFDVAGNYYIADETANVIRRVDGVSGIITSYAGNGVAGYYGDGGLATVAEIYEPIGVVVDPVGNLYISELGSATVRKVDISTGIISTVAGRFYVGYSGDGGPATAAELHDPRYIDLDKAGNLYIGDAGNNRIRKVDMSSGIITTVVGTGTSAFYGDGGPASAAELSYPYGVALDDSDNIYIADQSNNRIREVRTATGIINTIGGNGVNSWAGDGGPATAAEIFGPCAMSIARNGDVFIAGTYEQRIRKIDRATGIITTFAGTGLAGFGGDGGFALSAFFYYPSGATLDHSGNLYIPDWENSRVRMITLAETTTGTLSHGSNSNKDILVFPNPAKSELFIQFNGISGKASVTLFNMLGQQMLSQTSNVNQALAINVASLSKGIYLLKVQSEDGTIFIRKVELER